MYDKQGGLLGMTSINNNKGAGTWNHVQSLCTYIGCTDPDASNYAALESGKGTIYSMNSNCKYPEKIQNIEKPLLVIRQNDYTANVYIPKSGLNIYNEKNGTNYSPEEEGISSIFNDINTNTYNIVFGGKTFTIESAKMPIYKQAVWSNEYTQPLAQPASSIHLVLILKEIKSVANKSEFGISGDFYTHDFVFNEMVSLPINTCFINSNTKFDMNNNVSNEDKPMTYRIENVNDQLKCVQQQWITKSNKNECAMSALNDPMMKKGVSASADAAVTMLEGQKYKHDFSGNLTRYKMDTSAGTPMCKQTEYIPFGNPIYDDDLSKCPKNYTDCNGKYVAEPPPTPKMECETTITDDTNNRWLQILSHFAQ